jgi:hypothetical protein
MIMVGGISSISNCHSRSGSSEMVVVVVVAINEKKK